jgi:hypothetical protein
MVADVTVQERAAEALKEDAILPTARLQIGFGLQVLVTMGTFFILGYLGTKHCLGGDELWVRGRNSGNGGEGSSGSVVCPVGCRACRGGTRYCKARQPISPHRMPRTALLGV